MNVALNLRASYAMKLVISIFLNFYVPNLRSYVIFLLSSGKSFINYFRGFVSVLFSHRDIRHGNTILYLS